MNEVSTMDRDFSEFFYKGTPARSQMLYTPTSRNLEDGAIALDAYHSNGYREIDTHSLFGTMEVMRTWDWF